MRKTREDVEITRAVLLDAALKVFSQQGYEAARLEDIASQAGTTRGAIYYQFGGKAELYTALLADRMERANRVVESTFEMGGTPLQILNRYMVRTLQYLAEDADYRSVQEMISFKVAAVPELEAGLQKKREGQRAHLERLAKLVEAGIDTGEIRPGTNPRDVALAILGLLNGIALIWLLDTSQFSIHARAGAIVSAFLTGVVADLTG